MHQKYSLPLQNLLGVNVDNKYCHGKIYKIEPVTSLDIGDIYIGSTIKTLEQRMYGHVHHYANFLPDIGRVTSAKLFEKYGVENCQISLIEDFPCLSKKDLFTRESFYINSLSCINKQMKTKEKRCETCNYSCDTNFSLNRHFGTKNT